MNHQPPQQWCVRARYRPGYSNRFARLHYDWDWPADEIECKRGIELNPNYASIHHWYSHYFTLLLIDHADKAQTVILKALLQSNRRETPSHATYHAARPLASLLPGVFYVFRNIFQYYERNRCPQAEGDLFEMQTRF